MDFWHRWLSKCTYTGRWRDMVYRSALTLKLLTFEPTGAIVAAPTCSLPETVGGVRNWDYRYTWIRDAAFTLYGLLRIGFTEEAEGFMSWLEARAGEVDADGSLQIVYGIDGRHDLKEQTLDHLNGYRDSRPVRIGNGAYNQLQLDIYGANSFSCNRGWERRTMASSVLAASQLPGGPLTHFKNVLTTSSSSYLL